MFDRLAAYRARLSAWNAVKGIRADPEAQKGTVGSPGRSPLMQDKPEFAGVVLAEEAAREEAMERSQGIVRSRERTQADIAVTLSVLADLLRQWDQETKELRMSIWAESQNDPSFSPSSLNASLSARPGGELMKGVRPGDLGILQSICTVIAAAHRMAQG